MLEDVETAAKAMNIRVDFHWIFFNLTVRPTRGTCPEACNYSFDVGDASIGVAIAKLWKGSTATGTEAARNTDQILRADIVPRKLDIFFTSLFIFRLFATQTHVFTHIFESHSRVTLADGRWLLISGGDSAEQVH